MSDIPTTLSTYRNVDRVVELVKSSDGGVFMTFLGEDRSHTIHLTPRGFRELVSAIQDLAVIEMVVSRE
jgi:hypothetical protein